MKYNPQNHHRQSIRLPNYDYSRSGMYFVTICTDQKQCLLSEIDRGKMLLNQIGNIVREEWLKSSQIRQEIKLDKYVIMPNHLHGIVMIHNNDLKIGDRSAIDDQGARLAPLQDITLWHKPRSLSSFVAGFKSSVTKRIKIFCTQPNPRIWQRKLLRINC